MEPAGSGTAVEAVVMVTASSSSDVGDFSKTSFHTSAVWQAGRSGGEFSWSYPMPAPPVPGQLAPDVAWHYSSAAVDGQTVGQNVQPFWGEGWDGSQSGYVERSYRACRDDTANSPVYPNATSDLCWRLPNARMVLSGKSVELVLDDATQKWHTSDDDAAKVELLTNDTVNGSFNNEHWKVTTADGTQYHFGLNRLPGWQSGDRETGSTWTAPVFANHGGEPCFNGGGFAVSWCSMAYRWNLDYVVDRLGNTMSYWYSQETNRTALAGNPSATTTYVRAGTLDRIEYGTRAGTGAARESSPTATPPARMVFSFVDRCWSGSCPTHDQANYPDTPWDLDCAAAPCSTNLAPSFWSGRRIAMVATEVWSGSGATYNRADEWAFGVDFPGDASGNPLWITSITHTGKAGGTITLPSTLFYGVPMQNRADYDPNGTMANPMKYRITMVRTESGGELDVSYSAQDSGCQFGGAFPDPDNNTKRCFPRYWTNPSGMSGWAWWHKYVVTKVVEKDLVGGSPDIEHAYTYLTDGASTAVMWNHDDGAMIFSTPGAFKSWADWRGYPTVVEDTGPPTGQRSQTRTLYFRGLAQDMTDAGEGTRSSTLTNSLGEVSQDYHQFAGLAHEVQTLDGPGGQVLSKVITDPTRVALTATETHSDTWTYPTQLFAYITRTAKDRTLTWLPGTSSWMVAQTVRTWNPTYGVVATVDDQGDTATTNDDTCGRYFYTFPGTGAPYLVNFPHRVETVGVNCATTPTYPQDAVSDTRSYYDGATSYTTAPTAGNVTRLDAVSSYSGGTPIPARQTTTVFDQYGRATSIKDGLDHETLLAYTHTGGLVSNYTKTNALGHVTSTTLDTRRGIPLTVTDPNGKVTTASYDALGRLLKVWRPGHPTSGTPDQEFQYTLQQAAPSFLRSRVMGPNGNQIDSYEIYDGLLRSRQTQATAPSGKRTITDAQYDGRGLVVKSSQFYDSTAVPGSTLVAGVDTSIDNQQRLTYDNAGRRLTDELWSRNVFKWKTTSVYGGDRIGTLPPTGGTVTQDVLDAHGRVVQRQQYTGTTLTGTPDITTFSYDHAGRLVTTTDPAGGQTTFQYDLLGRQTQAIDPDTGTSSSTYDAASRRVTSTDGRGQTLAYVYDVLNRLTEVRDDSPSGALRAQWTYDPTGAKGQLGSSTRMDGGLAYTSVITGYSNLYQPTGTTVTIPASTANGSLAGSYTTSVSYKTNGAPATVSLPAAGGLPAETITTAYTTQGYASTQTSPLGSYVSSTSYAFDGIVTQQLFGASGARVKVAYSLDAATRRLTAVAASTETTTVGTYTSKFSTSYGYDQAGNVTSAAGKANTGGGLVADQEECFRYDYLRRLTTAWTQTSGACNTPQRSGADPYWRTWSFDSVGNRLSQVDKNASTGDTTWTYAVGAPVGVKEHQVKTVTATGPAAGTPTRTFGYDNAGNTTALTTDTGASQTLTWDREGRLATLVSAGATTSYLNDPHRQRLIRRDPDGTATLYLSGQELKKSPSGTVTATRFYGSVASRTPTGLTWLVADAHGTAQIAVDPATLAPTRRRTMPYGEPRGVQPPWNNDKVFVGGTADPTALTHLGAREYDPTIGRFISVDAVRDLQNPQQWHGYAYAGNNPTTSSDPSGLYFVEGNNGEGQHTIANGGGSAGAAMVAGQLRGFPLWARIDNSTLGGEVANPITVRQQVNLQFNGGADNLELEFSNLNQFQQRDVLAYVWCYNNPAACKKYLDEQEHAQLSAIGSFLWELTGIPDAIDCVHGSVSGCVWTIVGFVPFGKLKGVAEGAGAGADLLEIATKTERAFCSFSGDTRVLMADGTTKPIAEVEPGDIVLAANPESGEQGPHVVTKLWVHEDSILDLELEDGSRVTTTEDHPYWNATDERWEEIQSFDRGERLRTPSGGTVATQGLIWPTMHTAAAYNLTVADLHTYYVIAGDKPLLVHNNCGPIITQAGLDHSFDRHAAQWFGRDVSRADKMAEWQGLVERAAGSTKVVPWSSGGTLTDAYLARIDGKWFVAQFDRSTGDLVTAFVPSNSQVGAMLSLLGK